MAAHPREKLGILVGGGPAPGINGVIYSATVEALEHGLEPIGIYEGFKYLVEGYVNGIPLTEKEVAYIHNRGGSILLTARTNPTRSPEWLRNCVNALTKAGITYLISIGGDDTAFSAASVARFAQEQMGVAIRSAHVPKTIDNDLPLPEGIPTFGYETARELGAHLVMNLKIDALSARHWFLVLAMGRKAGHLALGIGKSSVATVTLIPEEWGGRPVRLQTVIDILTTTIIQRLEMGKPYGVAVIAEGIVENLDPEDMERLGNVARDEHGHLHLAEVNFLDTLKREMDSQLVSLGIQVRLVKHALGYELRCQPPTAFDVEYTRTLGQAAVEYLLKGGNNAIITIQGDQVVPIPYYQVMDPVTGRTEVRMVNTHSYYYRTAYKFMTRLKPEHAEDQAYLARLAGKTNLSLEEFKQRFGYLMDPEARPF
jgi:ATP-dependent phosphofructokinase / diphosphate-dependent phosphofructokinase